MKYLIWLAGTIGFAYFIKIYCFSIFLIPSDSMYPSLAIGDRVLCNKITSEFNKNDVIIFWKPMPEHPDFRKEKSYVMAKRIHGMNGDSVFIYDNKKSKFDLELKNQLNLKEATIIKKGDYFVKGEAENSKDSRFFGLVNDSLIIGKASFIVWSDWDEHTHIKDRTFNWDRFLKQIE